MRQRKFGLVWIGLVLGVMGCSSKSVTSTDSVRSLDTEQGTRDVSGMELPSGADFSAGLDAPILADLQAPIDVHQECLTEADYFECGVWEPFMGSTGYIPKMQLGKPGNKDLVSQWFKLIAASIRCDAGRVFGVQYGYDGHTGFANGIVPSGVTGNIHTWSHSANTDPVAAQLMIEFNAYFAQELKSFMDLLADIPEADGTTALDNTLIVWGTSMSDGAAHSSRNTPFVLLGGGATNLNMGRYFNFGNWPAQNKGADHDGKPHNHLLVTLLHAMGIEATHFGSEDIPSGNLDSDLLIG